jgi:hypothetical protein
MKYWTRDAQEATDTTVGLLLQRINYKLLLLRDIVISEDCTGTLLFLA